jgi:hypothetical protein
VFFVILGLLTALYFCCRYFNPKQDTDLLNELTKKYIREMSSASTSGSDNIVK